MKRSRATEYSRGGGGEIRSHWNRRTLSLSLSCARGRALIIYDAQGTHIHARTYTHIDVHDRKSYLSSDSAATVSAHTCARYIAEPARLLPSAIPHKVYLAGVLPHHRRRRHSLRVNYTLCRVRSACGLRENFVGASPRTLSLSPPLIRAPYKEVRCYSVLAANSLCVELSVSG